MFNLFNKLHVYTGKQANEIVDAHFKDVNERVSSLESRNKKLVKDNLDVAKRNRQLVGENQILVENNQYLLETILTLNSELDKAKQDKKPKEDIWAHREVVSSYSVDSVTDIRFDYCVAENGKEYMDARKYKFGKPTRKGICLSIDGFHEFLTNARCAWARIDSGLFVKREREAHRCGNCQGTGKT
jgi:hypothetical protein